jgi:metal-dependent hydrolase (beta-lactamase superfamily II)
MKKIVLVLVALSAAALGGQESPSVPLTGTIDIHVHGYPDSRPRALDGIEAARNARDRGMRAIVLKNHYEFTAGLAYIVRKQVPGIEVFGGVDLNLPVGGINPHAVEYMAQTSGGWGRIVWMPTFDAENAVRFEKGKRPSVSVSRNGELLPPVKEVIGLIAKHGLILATGHSSAEEGLMLVREGRRQGVKQMVVTHAMNPPIQMTVTQMQEATKLGALIEFVGGSLATPDAPARMDRFADAIKKIGPEFCILASDLGQQGNALPTDGYAAFLTAMRARGLTQEQVDRMSKQNPARLLGLP